MSTDGEREPLLPKDNPASENGPKPGTTCSTDGRAERPAECFMSAVPNHLTGETFDNIPVHKRKLGESWISLRLDLNNRLSTIFAI